ncbi:MAG: hypothetical protein HYZ28_27995 [Myxococcales bacterium]|nr:hypothetical protein [Myxococcales bacterium]
MKAIQITMDERLLASLDNDRLVKREGRSAVLRRLVAEYLRRRREGEISEAYQRSYSGRPDSELDGWADEGAWPSD